MLLRIPLRRFSLSSCIISRQRAWSPFAHWLVPWLPTSYILIAIGVWSAIFICMTIISIAIPSRLPTTSIPISSATWPIWRTTACSWSLLSVSVSVIISQIRSSVWTLIYVFVGYSRAAFVVLRGVFVVDLKLSWITTRPVGVLFVSGSLWSSWWWPVRIWGATPVARLSVSWSVFVLWWLRFRDTRSVSVWTVNGSAIELRQRRSCLLYTPIPNLPLIRTGWRCHLDCSNLTVDPCLVVERIVLAKDQNVWSQCEKSPTGYLSSLNPQRIIFECRILLWSSRRRLPGVLCMEVFRDTRLWGQERAAHFLRVTWSALAQGRGAAAAETKILNLTLPSKALFCIYKFTLWPICNLSRIRPTNPKHSLIHIHDGRRWQSWYVAQLLQPDLHSDLTHRRKG